MTVPFLDLNRLHASIRPELDAVAADVIDNSRFVGAASSRSFEQAFAAAHGRTHAIGCGSGTDALVLALVGAGVGAGDEVILPSMTFVATAEAVVHAGATPVLADVDPATLLLDAATVAAVRTERTKAVLPVHLYGNMVDPAAMRSWRDDGLVVVEDAAQAHLASRDGIGVGEVGHAACFSFYPGKNLGALGDGGAVLTDDDEIAARIASLRDHGRQDKYRHDLIGWCSRLDGMQAAFLEVKLRHLPAWTERRRRAAARYLDALGDRLVSWSPGAVHHLLVARVGSDRAAVAKALADEGIQTGIHYPVAMSDQPSLARWARPTPVAEAAAAEILSLPMDPLMTDDDVDRVIAAIQRLSLD